MKGLRLSPLESELFWALLEVDGQVLDTSALEAAAIHTRSSPMDFPLLLKVKICHLRKKLAGSRYRIETVRGQGYRLVSEAPPA